MLVGAKRGLGEVQGAKSRVRVLGRHGWVAQKLCLHRDLVEFLRGAGKM